MGNNQVPGCCNAVQVAPMAVYDVDSLVFRHLDFNKAETYKKLEKAAGQFTKKENLPDQFIPLISRIIANNQSHLLEAYRMLPEKDGERRRFMKNLEYVDIELVDSLYHNLIKNGNTLKSTIMSLKPCSTLDADILRAERKQDIFNRGLQTLIHGKVGLMLLCGGKNKRYGGQCKFLEPVTPSNKSIMDLMFMRLKALFSIAKAEWCLKVFMVCSQDNYTAIKGYLEKANYYGINSKNIMYFVQTTIPILNMKGQLCLGKDMTVIQSSNGCGEFLQAILNFKMKNKIIDEMGIQSLYVSGVENVLERPCDPLLIGTLLHDHGEIAAKCVDAYRENEDFNRYISVNGRIKSYSPKTISDMTMDARVKKSPIALNSVVYDTAYLNKLLSNHQLRFEISRLFHVDKRNFSYIDVRNAKELHDNEACYIFQKHLADLFIASDQITLLKVARDEQFAPLIYKNNKEYSLDEVRTRLMEIHRDLQRRKAQRQSIDVSLCMFTPAEVSNADMASLY